MQFINPRLVQKQGANAVSTIEMVDHWNRKGKGSL